jgi:hypothetical protein
LILKACFKNRFASGHDFSRAKNAVKLMALQAAEKLERHEALYQGMTLVVPKVP